MRVVLVTGAGRNLGKEISRAFAMSGHAVVMNARSADAVEKGAAEIVEEGGRAVGMPGDVTSEEDVRRIFDETRRRLGAVDVLVHCATTRVHRGFLDMSVEEWRLPFEVGLTGAFHCVRAALPEMIERQWGRVIFLAGVSGQTGAANRAGVVAAKSGLIGLTRALALEFAATGVTVNSVSPGLIDTERGEWTSQGDQSITTEHYRARKGQVPVGRMGRMSEVTAACRYLASEDAGFVTGQTLNVNGGMYLG
ncbi:MAG: SDR family oxidoreductase [Propionibacteriales bacterium]|nr:SDR family oxidoreductase [Propionibacteriales bacterium]